MLMIVRQQYSNEITLYSRNSYYCLNNVNIMLILQQLFIWWNVGGLPVEVTSTITMLLHQICNSK